MRFGKRLAELTQKCQSSQPYISYKVLKHSLGEISSIVNSVSGDSASSQRRRDTADSSGDEAPPADCTGVAPGAEESDSQAGPSTPRSRLKDTQTKFFSQIDTDVSLALSHIQKILATLETGVGDWQRLAAELGLVFTPAQLEEVAANLPFEVKDHQALALWLRGFQTPSNVRPARRILAERYSQIAASLQVVLQYIEVNITAVRKILKKFEKKVPSEFRMRSAHSYSAHHDLLMSDLQDLLVVVVHMHKLIVVDGRTGDEDDVRTNYPSPVSFIGPETQQVLQRFPRSELTDLITGEAIAFLGEINATAAGGARGPETAAAGTTSDRRLDSSLLSQQVALNLGNADMFQGPPKVTGAAANTNSGKAVQGNGQSKNGTVVQNGFGGAGNTQQMNGAGGRGKGQGGQAGGRGGKNGGGKGGRGQRGSRGQQPGQGGGGLGFKGGGGGAAHNIAPAKNNIDSMSRYAKGQHQNGAQQNDGNQMLQQQYSMFMMAVPVSSGMSRGAPPGSFAGAAAQANHGAKGGKGGNSGGQMQMNQMMGMMPNMEMLGQQFRGVVPAQFAAVGMMPDSGYPQGMIAPHSYPYVSKQAQS